MPWSRKQPSAAEQLSAAAGLPDRSADGLAHTAVAQAAAFRAGHREAGTAEAALAVVEELIIADANYDLVLAFVEDLQNLASHGLDGFLTAEEVVPLLGPRAAVCWTTVGDFWERVRVWSLANLPPLEPIAPILAVQNEDLRTMLWTSNRSLPDGEKLGLAHAVRYEKAGGDPLPGYDRITAAMNMS
jgi:hypothetical protein